MKFTVILGTAREGRKSVHAAEKTVEKLRGSGHEVFYYDLKEKNIPPLGNRTYRDEGPVPDDIQELSKFVEDSDGVIIVAPEYNHSIPGIMKTALDYLYAEYDEKPFSFITVSSGGYGGLRALNHLQDIVLELGGFIGPDMQISRIDEVFSEDGELINQQYEERFSDFIEESVDFVKRMK